jgi:hypothetical protein
MRRGSERVRRSLRLPLVAKYALHNGRSQAEQAKDYDEDQEEEEQNEEKDRLLFLVLILFVILILRLLLLSRVQSEFLGVRPGS